MPAPRDTDAPVPITREEAMQIMALALTVLHVQIGPGKRLPGDEDYQRQRIAERLLKHFEESGLSLYRVRVGRWHSIPASKQQL